MFTIMSRRERSISIEIGMVHSESAVITLYVKLCDDGKAAMYQPEQLSKAEFHMTSAVPHGAARSCFENVFPDAELAGGMGCTRHCSALQSMLYRWNISGM